MGSFDFSYRPIALRWMVAGLALTPAAACGAGMQAGAQEAVERGPGVTVTAENYAEFRRRYAQLDDGDASRPPLRDALFSYLDGTLREQGDPDGYAQAVNDFATLLSLLRPLDYERGDLPSALETRARWIEEHGSPRGDEATVLSALLVLEALAPREPYDEHYEVVADWTERARQSLPDPLVQVPVGVWERHAQLTPAPRVLDKLAGMYLERRDRLLSMIQREGPRLALLRRARAGPSSLALVQRTALDVAAVYLTQGDVTTARLAVARIEDRGDVGNAVLQVLVDASAGDDDALLEAAEAYRDGRPDAAEGACQLGHRRSPQDVRFVVCLARVHTSRGEYPQATGWYAEAIALSPGARGIYDEALDALQAFIARGIYDADPHDARGMAEAAVAILQRRLQRWPGEPPSVAPERLHYVIGLLEMNAGNASGAKARFEASVSAQETASSQYELGRLALGTGNGDEAARRFRRALDLTAGNTTASLRERARIMEQLGAAYRRLQNRSQAERHLREALRLWEQLTTNSFGSIAAEGQLRRGVILDRLGRRGEAIRAFQEAMDHAPNEREVYATILSHLVVAKPAAPELAQEVFSRALRELTLEPEWKVYFALWAEVTASRAGREVPADASSVLRSYSNGDAWYGSLARFGIGELAYTDLVGAASSVGERTEAYFYGGAQLLRSGDLAGAEALFRRVIGTNLVNFYEHAMALELVEEPEN